MNARREGITVGFTNLRGINKVRKCTEESFLKDVASHKMKVIYEDGINRHIVFCKKGSSDMRFDLITWYGYLCYTGDMGTYVFKRIPDMFDFFRSKNIEYDKKMGRNIPINLSYWHEKLEAVDRSNGAKEFSLEVFREAVKSYVDNRDEGYGENEYAQLVDAVKEQLLDNDFQFEIEARQAVEDFEFEGFEFSDFCEYDLQDYTHRYVWCCYAIAWGVQQYDNGKQK